MAFKKFCRILIYAGLSGMLVYSLLCAFLPLYKYLYMSLASLLLFLLMAVIMWVLGERASKNTRSGSICDFFGWSRVSTNLDFRHYWRTHMFVIRSAIRISSTLSDISLRNTSRLASRRHMRSENTTKEYF